MANDFYNDSGAPSNRSSGSSSTIRAEFAAIEVGFDKLPALSGAGSRVVTVNSGATALEATALQTAQAVTYQNSWSDYSGLLSGGSYFKDKQGLVHFEGHVKGGTSGGLAFTLPIGYRPAAQVNIGCYGGTLVQIDSNGEVRIVNSTSVAFIPLFGVYFRAA